MGIYGASIFIKDNTLYVYCNKEDVTSLKAIHIYILAESQEDVKNKIFIKYFDCVAIESITEHPMQYMR